MSKAPSSPQDFLRRLPDLSLRPQSELAPSDFTLARMYALVTALGAPQQRYPSIHVAGTNGKGSVCWYLAAALRAQGYRVGLYTSPHLAGPLAGIRVDLEPVPATDLETSWHDLHPMLSPIEGLTTFEVATTLAFLHFARAGVDVAVIETGLGGRLDATNVVKPALSIITPIDLEHTQVLGSSLAAIAGEKAGIIKPGTPIVMAPQAPEAGDVIRSRARAQSAPLTEVGRDVLFERVDWDADGQRVRMWLADQPDSGSEVELRMLGAHQAQNAATAYAGLQALERNSELKISEASLGSGFSQAAWPGRLQAPATSGLPVLMDAAHTPAAAEALGQSLNDHFPEVPLVAVMGVSNDKDVAGLLRSLGPRLASIYTVEAAHPRAMPADDLAAALTRSGYTAQALTSVAEALEKASTEASTRDTRVLVFGSVFLVEEALAHLD